MNTLRHSLLALLLLVLLLGSGPVPAQETEGDEGSTGELFFETVDVNVVNVEVYVTDKDGEPVKGLTRDDFEVLEERRPMEITYFYATEDGRPRVAADSQAPEEVDLAESQPPVPEAQRLYVAVYVDNFNIRPFNRNRMFRDLRQFLIEELDDQDQVMLVSYDRSLKVRHPFTNRSDSVARALFELENLTGYALQRDSERRQLLEEIDQADSLYEVEYKVRQHAESLANDARFTLSALKEFLGSLAGLEGRKALIYVSDGLEMIQAEDLFHAMERRFLESSGMSQMMDFNHHREFQRVIQLANANRVSIYTIDSAGLRVASSASAQSRGFQTPGLGPTVDAIYTRNLQSPLLLMAEETGGQAIINSNRFSSGLARIGRDFDTYYSLGYTPAHSGDGKYYGITVRLKNAPRGVRIRHREGYRDRSLRSRMRDRTTSNLMYGFESNPMSLNLRLGDQRPRENGNYVVPVAVSIPIGEIEMVEREQFHQGRIKLFVSAMDGEGRMSELQEIPLDLRIPSAEMEVAVGQPYVYTVLLEMRGGSHRLAVGVRDEIGATESFVSRTVNIGAG